MDKSVALLGAAAIISAVALGFLLFGYWERGSAEATEDYTGHIPPSTEFVSCEPEIENEKIPEPTEDYIGHIPPWELPDRAQSEKEENIKNPPAPASGATPGAVPASGTGTAAGDRRGPGLVELGVYTVTAYCSCSVCCGSWAASRPVVAGNEIVMTASGAVAQVGLTAAVDTSVIPFGAALWIEGAGLRIAQDSGAGVSGKHIDLYFADHAAALEWGRQTLTVWVLS